MLLVSERGEQGPLVQRAVCDSCGRDLVRYPAGDDPTWQSPVDARQSTNTEPGTLEGLDERIGSPKPGT